MMNVIRLFSFLILFSALFACDYINKKSGESNKAIMEEFPALPETIDFAGEKISLKDEDLIERLDRELLINENFRANTIQIIKRANRFFPTISKILKEEKVPDDFKYLAAIESALTNTISPAGAEGFWQIMPETAKEYNLIINDEVDERHHLEKSTRAAAKYLKSSYQKLGDWISTAAAYNRGVSGFLKDKEWQGMDHYFDMHMNPETGRYIFRILAMKLIMEQPEKYGFHISEKAKYTPFQTRQVVISESVTNLVSWSNAQGINYKILKKLNPWIKSLTLTVEEGRPYIISLPSNNYNLKLYSSYSQYK